MLLEGKWGAVVSFWAICCSSWIHMNSGTSKRSALLPEGFTLYESVAKANLLVSRQVSFNGQWW